MKKAGAWILLLVIALGLCACGGSSEENKAPQGLQIGYARKDIMPENAAVNISGGGNEAHRISTSYIDLLFVTCLAISENGNTILIYSTDTLTAKEKWTNEARQMISKATGVPEANIQIGGTHTHTGPAVGSNQPLVQKWKAVYINALIRAAEEALADQAATTIYGHRLQTEDMTFVRHYKMRDGSYAGANFGNFSKGIVDHATEANEEMILLKMEREGDKKDILLMNFQAHPCFAGVTIKDILSSDFIGVTRDVIEEQTGMHFIYFTGSAGNQNAFSQIAGEGGVHNKRMKEYGTKLAQYAIDALPAMTTPIVGTGTIKTSQKTFEYKSNDYGQDRLAEARLVNQQFAATGDTSACNAYAKSLGFHSVHECRGIVSCAGYPPTGEMELNVCSFGGVGFVAAPHEMFSNTAFYIHENSPFEFTIISTTTNGYNNYYPTKEAFAYGCYESFTARFASGVAEFVQEKYVEMLKEVQ